jgi:positive regulator of sigma E activity
MDLLLFFFLPLIGMLWFLNLVTLIKKIKEDKACQNQIILGAALSFIFIGVFMFWIVGLY